MKHCIVLIIAFVTLIAITPVQAQDSGLDSIKRSLYIEKDLDSNYVDITNTGARFKPPKYFEPFAQGEYYGFMHKGTGANIIGQFLPGTPFISIATNMNKETFEKQGAILLEQFDFKTIAGAPAYVFIIRFEANKVPINRIMFFTGDYQNTILLTANYPELFSSLLREVMLTSFSTVIF